VVHRTGGVRDGEATGRVLTGWRTLMAVEIIGFWEWQRRVGTRELRVEAEIRAYSVREMASRECLRCGLV
jgi:hypothetical protein